jgi:hypothetical protein
MLPLEEEFTVAIDQGKIPGTILMATDKTGKFRY